MQNVPREWRKEFESTLMNECFVKVELETDNETITFTKLELTNFEVSVSANPICSELPTARLKFSIENSEKQYSYISHLRDKLKRMQKVTASVGITINGAPYYIKAGTFWLDTWEFPNGGLEIHFEARDAFYFLNQRKYIYGLFRPNGISLYDLADEVLTYAADVFPCVTNWEIDNSMNSDSTTAALPVCSYAECLQFIAQAAGNVLIYDRDGTIKFALSPGSSVASAYQIPRNICFKYPQFTLYPELQKLKCAVYNYSIDELVSDAAYFPNINGGQRVTALDASDILKAAANIGAGEPSGLTPEQEVKADADRDGMITASDANLVLQFVAACGAGDYENTPDGWALFLNIHQGIKEKIYDGYHEIDGDTEIVITHSPSAEVNVVVDNDVTLESVSDYTNATDVVISGNSPHSHVIAYGYPINVNSYEYNRDVSENGEFEYIDNPLVTNAVMGQTATNKPKDFLKHINGVDCSDFRIDPSLDCGDMVQVLGNGTDIPTVDAIITNIDYKFTGMFRGSCSGRITRFVPVYNESKVAIIELDSNDEPTGKYNEYDNIRDAAIELLSNPDTPYMMRIGDECTFMDQIPNNAFYRSYASQNYGIEGNYDNLHRLYTGMSHVIGQAAFQECANLNDVEFKQVVVINENAFLHCDIEILDFPSSLMAIYGRAFAQQGYNDSLKSITFREGLMALYARAFVDNDGLHYVELPSSMTYGQSAFNGCHFLEVIRLHKSEMPAGFNLNGNSGCGCVVLDWVANLRTTKIDANGELMSGHPEDVVEWDTVDHIRSYLNAYSMYGTSPAQTVQVEFLNNDSVSGTLFASQDRIKRAVFAEGITDIPDGIMYNCAALEKVEIASTVETIGASSFYASNLAEIIIHKPQNSISGAPWGATNATITWTG